jgi:hypothetical protein
MLSKPLSTSGGRRKKSSGSNLTAIYKAVVACLCVWLLIQIQYFLHTHKKQAALQFPVQASQNAEELVAGHDASDSLTATGSLKGGARVAILLQMSPVRPARQLSRLQTIDKGYASWTRDGERGNGERSVTVFAAVHNTTSLSAEDAAGFQNIQLLRTYGDNPFHKLLDAFIGVMSDDIPCEWVVMANDHSFFIPSNLQRYLHAFQSDDLFYGGNRLGLMLHDKFLSFASGGAGAVFSRATVNGLLVLWSLLHREYMQVVLSTLQHRDRDRDGDRQRDRDRDRQRERERDRQRDGDTSFLPPAGAAGSCVTGGGGVGVDFSRGGDQWLEAVQCLVDAFAKQRPDDDRSVQVTAQLMTLQVEQRRGGERRVYVSLLVLMSGHGTKCFDLL